MKALRLSARQITARAAASAAASLADLSTGAAAPTLRIFAAPAPADLSQALSSGLLLVTVALAAPAGEVLGADLVLYQAEDALIAVTGVPAYAVLVDGAGAVCADMTVGPAPALPEDERFDVEINQPTLFAGGYLRLAPLTITG